MQCCHACMHSAPGYNEAAKRMIEKNQKVKYCNVDGLYAKDFNKEYDIRAVPQILIFKNGELVEKGRISNYSPDYIEGWMNEKVKKYSGSI